MAPKTPPGIWLKILLTKSSPPKPLNTRENIDELNAVVKVEISKEDYSPKVEKILKDYRKNANIPGFRKGHVPMGLVKKQYGQAVLVDEVNKLLQENLIYLLHN